MDVVEEISRGISGEKAHKDLMGGSEVKKKTVDDVKDAVYGEYERALVEGTATREQVVLQKKHIQPTAFRS